MRKVTGIEQAQAVPAAAPPMHRWFAMLLVPAMVLAGCTRAPGDADPSSASSSTAASDTPPHPSSASPASSGATAGTTVRSGALLRDETWSGTVLIDVFVEVPQGVTLTIAPGTRVEFRHNRDYRDPWKGRLDVAGTLRAVGTPENRIWFTSDADDPQNGDWSMVHMRGRTGSEIRYAVLEYGQQGVNLWQSDAVVSHSIVRWNNWEGIYAESYSTPTLEYNRVYQNGYNGLAMEQFNDATVRFNLFEASGTHGIHIDASKARVEGNVLRGNGAAGLSLDNAAEVQAVGNTVDGNRIGAIMCGEGANRLDASDNSLQGDVLCPSTAVVANAAGAGAGTIAFGYDDVRLTELGYTPGDRAKDRYAYVYPDDETRRIVARIGTGLGLTWSVAVEGHDVWTSALDGRIYKLNGTTGAVLRQLQAPSPQPWGMAFDGTRLWLTDFAEKRTYALDPQTGAETFSFNNPDQERGAKGLAWDGQHLYVFGWTTGTIYRMTPQGQPAGTIQLPEGGGGLAWDGAAFWAPCGPGICRFQPDGKLVGAIYAASEGTWDLAWEPAANARGGYLWATQRTNENWHDDAKLFKLEILDDQVALR
jgi:hypothetical protein